MIQEMKRFLHEYESIHGAPKTYFVFQKLDRRKMFIFIECEFFRALGKFTATFSHETDEERPQLCLGHTYLRKLIIDWVYFRNKLMKTNCFLLCVHL